MENRKRGSNILIVIGIPIEETQNNTPELKFNQENFSENVR